MFKDNEKSFKEEYKEIMENFSNCEDEFDSKVLYFFDKTSEMDKHIKLSLISMKKALIQTQKNENCKEKYGNLNEIKENINISFKYSANLIKNLDLEYKAFLDNFLEFFDNFSNKLDYFMNKTTSSNKGLKILIDDETLINKDKIEILNTKTDEFKSYVDDFNSPVSSCNSLNILSNSYFIPKINSNNLSEVPNENISTISNKKTHKKQLSYPDQTINTKGNISNRNLLYDIGSKITLSLENEILQREIENLTKLIDTPNSINFKQLNKNENKKLQNLATPNSNSNIRINNTLSDKETNTAEKLLQEKKYKINVNSTYLNEYLECLFNSLNININRQLPKQNFIEIKFIDKKNEMNDYLIYLSKRSKISNLIQKERIFLKEKPNLIIYFKYQDKNKIKENYEEKILISLIFANLYKKNYVQQITFFERMISSFENCDQGEKKIEKIMLYKNISCMILIRFCETIKSEFEIFNYKITDSENVHKSIIEKFLLIYQNSFILKKCFTMWIREILVKFYIFLNIDNQYLDIFKILNNPNERIICLEIFIKMLKINYNIKDLEKKTQVNIKDSKLNQFLNSEKRKKFIKIIREELKCFNIENVELFEVNDYNFEEESIVSLKLK